MPYADPVRRSQYKLEWKRKKRIASGNPARTDLTPIEVFMRNVIKTNDCWIWTGPVRSKSGAHHYGCFSINKKRTPAHRWLFEFKNGPISSGLFCCHKCDNPKCARPDHIFLGTQADNIADCIRKGRHSSNRNAEKTHCPSGHEYNENNTRLVNLGRRCRTCERLRYQFSKLK